MILHTSQYRESSVGFSTSTQIITHTLDWPGTNPHEEASQRLRRRRRMIKASLELSNFTHERCIYIYLTVFISGTELICCDHILSQHDLFTHSHLM